MNSEIIIGIDLGTTNSEVALIHEGKPTVLKIDGSKIVPSVVSLDPQQQILIGKAAVNNELAAPTQTIRCVKRKMGREEIILLGGQNYTPEMISSLILRRLKLAAEEFLGHPVHKAVITVPAFFTEKQREATKKAAELAGLEPVRLLNEPTAAAIAYSQNKKTNELCLVYDLGGGTFDVSIVSLSEQLMEVKASHGDAELGGSDFDRLIAEQARQAFLKEHAIDLAKDPLAWARLMRAAEAAKIRLSDEATAQIIEEFITTKEGAPLHLKFTLLRTDFEALIRPMLQRTLASIKTALEMASLQATDLQRVILVGGATYTPLVSQMIEEELHITPQAWLDPSTVVAIGAAIEGASLAGQAIGPMMVDVTPHSLGTGCVGPSGYLYNHILIRRNTPLPCSASQVFYKMSQNQSRVEIDAYQGESSQIDKVQRLGDFLLEDLDDCEGNEILIKFQLDRSGILHVTGTDVSSGKSINQILKKAASDRVQHVKLTDLQAVRINVDPVEDDSFSIEEALETIWESKNLKETDAIAIESDTPVDAQSQELIDRARSILAEGNLAPTDQQELSAKLTGALTGDQEALKRLANLCYYLA